MVFLKNHSTALSLNYLKISMVSLSIGTLTSGPIVSASDSLDARFRQLGKLNTSETKEYLVKDHDTYMLISYKLYGDYRLWRQIYKLNSRKKNKSPNTSYLILRGEVLKYHPLKESITEFHDNTGKKGSSYVVKKNDSLEKISKKFFQKWSKWNKIWKNNIKTVLNPNFIFPGMTIYIPDKSGNEFVKKSVMQVEEIKGSSRSLEDNTYNAEKTANAEFSENTEKNEFLENTINTKDSQNDEYQHSLEKNMAAEKEENEKSLLSLTPEISFNRFDLGDKLNNSKGYVLSKNNYHLTAKWLEGFGNKQFWGLQLAFAAYEFNQPVGRNFIDRKTQTLNFGFLGYKELSDRWTLRGDLSIGQEVYLKVNADSISIDRLVVPKLNLAANYRLLEFKKSRLQLESGYKLFSSTNHDGYKTYLGHGPWGGIFLRKNLERYKLTSLKGGIVYEVIQKDTSLITQKESKASMQLELGL